IRAANSPPASAPLWSGNYTLDQGTSYQIIAEGLLDEAGFEPFIPFDLAVYVNARQSAMITGNTDMLIHHGSTDAPAVTITADDTVMATNLAYGNFAGYFEVPSQNIVVGVLDA
ncbi:hypothetical protein RZS08_49590, partial [Arthrospira platensis SPKY1]|nr:hypothetical protein [Arthrospira platensis SPKY1]